MADAKEKLQENETKIPVFTVLKKGSILKNIFLNYPPPELESTLLPSTGNTQNHGQEEGKIIIGRHPDCHVVLDHPSISRFHLEIRIQPSLQKLRVTDLSSVHGTWVSGNKIQPHVQVDLEDGDTMRLGASTRIYRLRWISIGGDSDLENPLEALSDDDEEETHQVEKSMPITDNPNGLWDTEIPSAPPMPESVNPSSPKENFYQQVVNHNQTSKILEASDVLGCCSGVPMLESVESSFSMEGNRIPEAFLTAEMPHERENPINSVSEKQVKSSSLLSRRSKSVSFLRIHRGRSKESIDGGCFDARIEAEQRVDGNEDSEQRKGGETLCKVLFVGLEGQEDAEEETVQKENLTPEIFLRQKLMDQTELKRSYLKATLGSDHEEVMFTTDKENQTSDISIHQNLKDQKESIGLDGEEDVFPSDKKSIDGVCFDATIDAEQPVDGHGNSEQRKGAETLKVLFVGLEGLEDDVEEETVQKETSTSEISLCLKLKDQTELKRSSLKATLLSDHEKDRFTPDKDNLTSDTSLHQNVKDQTELMRSSLKSSMGLDGEEDAFPSYKENLTPEVSCSRKSKNHTKLQRSYLNAIDRLHREEDLLASDKENLKDQTELMGSSLNSSMGLDGEEEVFPSDKENLTPQVSCRQKSKDQTKLQNTYLNAIDRLHREEDLLASDKEILTPKTLLCWELEKDKTGLQRTSLNALVELEGEDVFLSDKENWTPVAPKDFRKLLSESSLGKEKDDEEMFALEKENQTPQVSRDLKSSTPISQNCQRIESEILKRRVERVPFQSLLEKSVSNSKSASVAISSNSVKHSQKTNQSVDQMFHSLKEGKKRWNIVVDTSCFLNEESRRSLQLLEGIRGTHLIVPRMVIRELDCLKRRENRFRKAMKGSPPLQWIEECMVKTSWWIHVQSSVEIIPVPPTPPASPRSRLSEGSYEFPGSLSNSMPFSTCGSLAEIVSPTAEDHILDCALLFQRIRNDGQLVLLSNNISLKIKAMAEGLLCETPMEFRESLVNPLSERFLWVESSPRGPTWSCVDNGGLIENYYHQDLTTRKTGKAAEGAKGLKLILLHNSHYGLTNLVN